jgi:hypothetical protein
MYYADLDRKRKNNSETMLTKRNIMRHYLVIVEDPEPKDPS